MPELPEVETTRRGIAPHVIGQCVTALVVRQPRLRWPVPPRLARELVGRRIGAVERRAKYLLLGAEGGTLIVHLGMSGSLRVVPTEAEAGPHDHVDWILGDRTLRLTDPRRFGAVLWTRRDPATHRLLAGLGPEPLDGAFDGAYLHAATRGRRAPIKSVLLDARVVAGVGNIYASEALFRAGIHPLRAAGRISARRATALAGAVREVLSEAIRHGGTTLRDFVGGDGRPGYFRIHLDVYGRAGSPCSRCGATIRRLRVGQRSTFYCPRCQR